MAPNHRHLLEFRNFLRLYDWAFSFLILCPLLLSILIVVEDLFIWHENARGAGTLIPSSVLSIRKLAVSGQCTEPV